FDAPICKALVLKILSSAGPGAAAPLALKNLHHPDPEVRSQALKVIGAAGNGLGDSGAAGAAALLSDPVWFVRLQAAKALGNLGYEKAMDRLGDALLDSNWQVRNAAATSLTKFGNRSISIFLGTLLYKDRYAKESICEEIQKTGFIDILFENLTSKDAAVRTKSKRILGIMKSLNYCTPILEYMNDGTNEETRFELGRILHQEHPAPL
ncbi:MAG: HEAT repeat domain-containing protein, partial [Deltaproteobacteria bacterium]